MVLSVGCFDNSFGPVLTVGVCRLCVHSMFTISFKVLPMVPLVTTVGCQYCSGCKKSHMIQYGFLNFRFIKFANKRCFNQDDISKL